MTMLQKMHEEIEDTLRGVYTDGESGNILPLNLDTDDALGELPLASQLFALANTLFEIRSV